MAFRRRLVSDLPPSDKADSDYFVEDEDDLEDTTKSSHNFKQDDGFQNGDGGDGSEAESIFDHTDNQAYYDVLGVGKARMPIKKRSKRHFGSWLETTTRTKAATPNC